MISRREFVIMTGAAVATSRILFAAEKVPTMLDHLLLGCGNLDAGIAFVEKHTGVKAALGGVHPRWDRCTTSKSSRRTQHNPKFPRCAPNCQ
jgi:hypothetical protein